MAGVDDTIKQWIARAEKTGELKRGRFWGKPFNFNDGFLETPARIRMIHKILKNAGHIPAELALMQDLARRKEALLECNDPDERKSLRKEIANLQQKVSLALERANSTLVQSATR